MMRPALNAPGEWLYDRLAPWTAGDSDATGWPVATICRALGLALNEIFTASEAGLDGLDGPDTAPVWYLPHLAMKAGVRVVAGWSEADLRNMIRTRPAERRGTPNAIVASAQTTLTGNRTVRLIEKASGDAYALVAITRTAETPDPPATLAAMLEQKPVGLTLTHLVVDGWTIGEMEGAYAGQAIGDLEGDFASIGDLEDNNS